MTPFPQPIKRVRYWLGAYCPTLRMHPSDWGQIYMSMGRRDFICFVEKHLLGVDVPTEYHSYGPFKFVKYKTKFPDRFYLETKDGQHALIIKDKGVKRGHFLG